MNAQQILHAARAMNDELVANRRHLHRIPEIGFDLEETLAFVDGKLTELGIPHETCGRAGIVATIGGKQPGKVFMLRADMDALPMAEESGEEFAAAGSNMHACGHDLHTTILLGAAKILKEHEDAIRGTVKLMFQPAEEIFCGAADMIDAGVLENPRVDAAMMLHVFAGMPIPTGLVVVCDGVSNAAADVFTIHIQGKGCHGSMPSTGIDPLLAGAHILIALQELHSRELAMSDEVALTFGTFQAGQAANVIPDTARMSGTLRTFSEELRSHVKQRMEEIVTGLARAFRTEATITYTSGCPVVENDQQLCQDVASYLQELLGPQGSMTTSRMLGRSGGMKASGSEDFAFISQKVPSVMLGLPAGNAQTGHLYPQHHPKVRFDEAVLPTGCAAFAYAAMRWLEEHR